MNSLKAELNGLAWLDYGIPAQVSRAVTARHIRIPGAAQAGAFGVFPIYRPAVNGRSPFVGDADRTGET